MEWYIPSTIAVAELQRTLNVINQFLETPYDLDGKRAAALLNRKRRRRRRRSPSPDSDDDGALSENEPRRKKRKEKKIKEKEQYKSAQFIEDSDEEYGGMEAFLEKERVQREKAQLAAALAGPLDRPTTMKATGTKKRRRKGTEIGSLSKKRKASAPTSGGTGEDSVEGRHQPNDSDLDFVEGPPVETAEHHGAVELPPVSRPRPRPRPKPKASSRPTSTPASEAGDGPPTPSQNDASGVPSISHTHRSKRLIISDEED